MKAIRPERTSGERSRTSRRIYLDWAATNPVDPEVLKKMLPYFNKIFGNPSEPHFLGVQARKDLEAARKEIARFFKAKDQEIIFTSGATESINLAIKGLIEAVLTDWQLSDKPHIITTAIEHKAVLETCHHLEELKLATVTYLPVDQDGLINLLDLKKAFKKETVLVSIMYVNNEVGTIQPISEIGQLLKKINTQRTMNNLPKTYFHTDATQAIAYLNCQVNHLNVDLLSFSGHKLSAPKGIGVIYLKKGTPLIRQIDGGNQEKFLRSGTENVPFIIGLAKALEIISQNKQPEKKRLENLRDQLINSILKIPKVHLTGHFQIRAPHIASFVVEGVEGEAMVLLLSAQGVMVSSGSACTSSSLSSSHVLLALGIKPENAHGSLRISLGSTTTQQDLDYFLAVFLKVIKKLRKMAPVLS